jgi:hypothetical protein
MNVFMYLFCGLFDDAVSGLGSVAPYSRLLNKLGKTWKETVVAYLEIQSRHLFGRSEVSHENLSDLPKIRQKRDV